MNLSTWSIHRPLPTLVVFVLLLVAGLWGGRAMRVQNMPDVDLPAFTVSVAWPGATPEQMEAEVVHKLEGAIGGVRGLRDLSTTVVEGGAVIGAEFRLEQNLARARDDVLAAVAQVRANLPPGVKEPVVAPVELAGLPMLTVVVSSPQRDLLALSRLVDETVAPSLRALPGVGRVARVGGVSRELRIEPDVLRLLSLNLTLADLAVPLRQMLEETAGGKIRAGTTEMTVRALPGIASTQDLAQRSLPLADGRRLRLAELATVQDTLAKPHAWALLNGQRVVAFEVSRARGASELQVAEAVRRVLAGHQAEMTDLKLYEAFSVVEPVRESFEASVQMLLEGALLTVVVVGLFLRNARATLIAAVAMPMAAIPTLAVMHLMGFSLNALTLLSLSLVVGVLVDDAIVEIENIVRHLHMGKPPLQAAIDASQEIGPAVIATTLALVAVFLPTAFMGGVVGRYFQQFGWTAAVAVAFSLLVARMLTPMMAALLLKPLLVPMRPSQFERSAPRPMPQRALMRLTRLALRHPVWTLVLTAMLLVSSVLAASRLPAGFLPPEDLPYTQVVLTAAPGGTADHTLALAEQARLALAGVPHVRQVFTTIGAGQAGGDAFEGPGLHEASRATLTLQLSPRHERTESGRVQIEADLRRALSQVPGVQWRMGLGGGAERLAFTLQAMDGQALARHAQQVVRELQGLPGIGGVQSAASAQRLALVAVPHPERAAERGVSTGAIGEALRLATLDVSEGDLPRVTLQGQQVPVNLRLQAAVRDDPALLQQLLVTGSRGPVMLDKVASLQLQAAPARIERRQQQRSITFEVELNGRALGDVERQALSLPSLASLPAGITLSPLGDSETMDELFEGFRFAMVAGVLCMLAVLVLLFKDLAQPFTVLAALVLAAPGAVLALALLGTELSMPALIGLVMLMGITAKNAILLVDHVITARRERGVARDAALLAACAERAQPIIMTTLAMSAGMLPTALGLGSDPGFRMPLAVVVIGGLLSSTVMSLVVVPVVYQMIDDLVAALWPRSSGPSAPQALSGQRARVHRPTG